MSKGRMIVLMVLLACGLLTQVQAQSVNWLLQVVVGGIPQTQVVRDPLDRSRYYLCWTDGTNHYGTKFSRRSFDDWLGQMKPGSRTPLGSVLTLDPGGWTAADDRTCWGH
jgi:hypothetical protein